MNSRVQIGAGVLLGTLAAGPVFMSVLLIGVTALSPDNTLGEGDAWALPFLMVASIPLGSLLAFLPILLGATVLGRLAAANEGVRLPVFWALTGGAVAGAPAWALAGSARIEVAALFAATGALCAAITRSKVRWTEGELAPRYGRA